MPITCLKPIYNNRHHVDLLWARLKDWRVAAARYEKAAMSFVDILCLAAAADLLRCYGP